MKRLFRTSKSGIDPLPPPPPAPANPANGVQYQHEHPPQPKMRFVPQPTQGSVTPFPIDVGRNTAPQPPPKPRPEKDRGNGPPSLLEIQQMQDDKDQTRRRDEWLASQRQGLPPPRPTKPASNPIPSPEGWSVVNAPNGRNGHELHNSSGASTPTIQQSHLYLPPGARPPSPPPSLRPGTPPRPTFPSNRQSQSSVTTSTGQYRDDVDPYAAPVTRAGRERGHSGASISARSSDHESSHGHSLSHMSPIPPQPLSKTSKPPLASSLGTRSPLGNPYHSPEIGETHFPQPHPYAIAPPMIPVTQLSEAPQTMKMYEQMDNGEREGGKEKKKFWGMQWGDKKDKEKEKARPKEMEPATDEPRRSMDWREGSNHGHGTTASSVGHDEESRGRVLGLDLGRGRKERDHKEKEKGPAQVEKVTTAIQLLCSHPDPPLASTYEVCDRINHSSGAESVGKEAASALRKVFKHGNEAERRNAAKIWLVTMRNISIKGYRGHAASKKFMTALEPILLAPPGKQLVSSSTHRWITDVLADLTYTYGSQKGCEALGELWKKVKMPQEPELGVPMPSDHQLYAPNDLYAPQMPNTYSTHPPSPSALPPSRRPSSPNMQHLSLNDRSVAPPVPMRGPSPVFGGYAQLPNHHEDMRRLTDECTAAKESARVLAEALVFTRPEELAQKPVIQEFYQKCFHAHESLTNQIEWAQAEAVQSRERVNMQNDPNNPSEEQYRPTFEEQALGSLFEAHGSLAEVLKQHDDLDNLAADEREMKEVRERSKKEMRMDRNQQQPEFEGLAIPASQEQGGSSSRSPSPAPHSRLPVPGTLGSPRPDDVSLPIPHGNNNPFRGGFLGIRSRTPSPDRGPLPQPPKIVNSPSRAPSPLGRTRATGPRPLPNPMKNGTDGSQQSLGGGPGPREYPSRSGTGSTNDDSAAVHGDDEGFPSNKPSRKALGKRRAVVDEDNQFNPDDLFGGPQKKDSSDSSDESITADHVYLVKPVKYAYDAYQEKLEKEASSEEGGSASGMRYPVLEKIGGGSQQSGSRSMAAL